MGRFKLNRTEELLVHEGLTFGAPRSFHQGIWSTWLLMIASSLLSCRFAQCEHVMDKLMQRGEQMEWDNPAPHPGNPALLEFPWCFSHGSIILLVIWVIDMSDPFQFHYVWAPKVFVPWMVWCLSDLASSCTASIGQGDVIILVGPLWEFLGIAKFHARVYCPWLVDVHMQPWTLSSRMERVISWFDVAYEYGSTLQIDWKHITLPEANITPETLLEDEFPTVKIGFLAGAR